MVSFEWYRSFVAVYQSGTTTAAASQRNLTQPTLSQHIAALEQALKTRLFERSARRMIPSDAAKMLYPKISAAVERLEAIESQSLPGVSGSWLRIGAPLTYLYEYCLPQLSARFPGKMCLKVRLGETPELLELLVAGDLDGVIATQKTGRARIHYIPLLQEAFVLVAARHIEILHPVSCEAVEAWLSRQPWISYSAEMPIIRRYWQAVFKKRPEFEPRIILPDLHAILRAVDMGLGISIVPSYLFESAISRFQIHQPWQAPVQVNNMIYFACQRKRLREPLIETAIEIFMNNGSFY